MNEIMQMQPVIIREAEASDIPGLVDVHVVSWNHAYSDYEPKPTAVLRLQQWKKLFKEKEYDWFCYLAQNQEGNIIGFASACRFNDPELPFEGELSKIHIYPWCHRQGTGTKLLTHVVDRFLIMNIQSMILFADPQNQHIGFYEKWKAEKIYDSNGIFQGCFGWRNLEDLAARLHQ